MSLDLNKASAIHTSNSHYGRCRLKAELQTLLKMVVTAFVVPALAGMLRVDVHNENCCIHTHQAILIAYPRTGQDIVSHVIDGCLATIDAIRLIAEILFKFDDRFFSIVSYNDPS